MAEFFFAHQRDPNIGRQQQAGSVKERWRQRQIMKEEWKERTLQGQVKGWRNVGRAQRMGSVIERKKQKGNDRVREPG